MIILVSMPFELEPLTEIIFDTALLVILSIPIIYIWIIKPYLAAHEAQLASILENTDDAYLTIDTDWIITYANPVSMSLLDIDPEKITGHNFKDELPDMVSMFYKMLNKTFSTQTAQEATVLYEPTMKYLEAHSCPVAEGLLVNFRDITSRRLSEDKLARAKQDAIKNDEKVTAAIILASYNEAIGQHALVSVTDTVGTIIEANDKFCEITGYSKEELIGSNHSIINSGAHPKTFFAKLWSTIANGHKWHGEICNRAKNGSLYWVDSAIVPIKNIDGEIERYLSVRIDITERKYAEKELNDLNVNLETRVQDRTRQLNLALERTESASNAKSQFLASMSHELRTPLHTIMGYSQMLSKKSDIKTKDRADKIYGAGVRLLNLVDDVLDLTSIETGHMELNLKTVNLHDLLDECRIQSTTLAEKMEVDFDVSTCNCPSVIMADHTRLKQVVLNLISNAIKYNRKGGSIYLSCSVNNEDQSQITVRDTGYGIESSRLEELFEPFNRLGKENGAIEGLGIGLVVTKNLVEMMGFTLNVNSVVDEGTTFWIEIPSSSHINSLDNQCDPSNIMTPPLIAQDKA